MSITISITDPKSAPRAEIEALVAYFNTILGDHIPTVPSVPAITPEMRAALAPFKLPPTPLLYPTPEPSVQVVVPPVPEPHAGRRETDPVVDARGFPWDARIHAESKNKNGDGTWRYRRGVKDDVIEPVEAELRGVMGMASAAPTGDGVHHTAHTTVDPTTAIPTPPAPPAASDVPPPPPAAAEPASADDFNHLANIATKALAAKTITQAQITAILGEIGTANGCVLPHLGALFTRKDLIPAVLTRLQTVIAAGGAV